jgi:hypothetical protein
MRERHGSRAWLVDISHNGHTCKHTQTNNVKDLPRSGRPQVTSDRDDMTLQRLVRRMPFATSPILKQHWLPWWLNPACSHERYTPNHYWASTVRDSWLDVPWGIGCIFVSPNPHPAVGYMKQKLALPTSYKACVYGWQCQASSFKSSNRLPAVPWPAMSPDLNPIEYIREMLGCPISQGQFLQQNMSILSIDFHSSKSTIRLSFNFQNLTYESLYDIYCSKFSTGCNSHVLGQPWAQIWIP